VSWEAWHIPLSRAGLTMRAGLENLAAVGARQQQIPLSVRLLENPKYSLPGFTLFHGAVDLRAHVCIHPLPGRGSRCLPCDWHHSSIHFRSIVTSSHPTWISVAVQRHGQGTSH
jgi:hypothetical protein